MRASAADAAGLLFLAFGACLPEPPPDPVPVVDAGALTCAENDDCTASGTLCVDGSCVAARCDPALSTQCRIDGLDSTFCCASFERCNEDTLDCELDPDVSGVIGCGPDDDDDCVPCDDDTDCDGGEFCSSARCTSATGAEDCVTSFDCPVDQRCDRVTFLCVEDRGGCDLCGANFPELCCEEAQLCAEDTNVCVDVAEAECDDDADCTNSDPFCEPFTLQCVQCRDDDDCGPGLFCIAGNGVCVPDDSFLCESDEDCDGNRRCSAAISQCVIPQCEDDDDCAANPDFDERYLCDVDAFLCVLPPAVCTEDVDEENDTLDEATLIEDGVALGGLCRDDVDFWMFPVIPERSYELTVDVGSGGHAGISVTLFGTDEVVESFATFTGAQSTVSVVGVTDVDEDGFFYMSISNLDEGSDFVSYTITVVESGLGG